MIIGKEMGVRRKFTVALFIVVASIDNTVLALIPALGPSIKAEFGVSNRALGLLIGLNLLVVAVTAVGWGYRSDQSDRRRLLIAGTLAWTLPVALVPWSTSFPAFAGLMILAGLGLGCISTVGYTIITDLVATRWRGILLAIWGLAQGIGALLGGILVGVLTQGSGWRAPFGLMAIVGVACSALTLLALSPTKGAADEALKELAEEGAAYNYRIQVSDLGLVLAKPSNRYLMLQGFLAQFTFGSLTWLTVLLTAKLTAQGVALDLANGIAALFAVILQLGGVVSVFWGYLGDRLQRRRPQARALLAAAGFWFAMPFFMLLFWVPLPLASSNATGALQVVGTQLGRNGWWWLAIIAATCAVAAQATNAPNWYALVSEVNLPEHRGTAFSFVTLANNVGRALGTILVGVAFDWLQRTLAAPANYALGLTLFQLFFLPAGLCFWLAARTTPVDAAAVSTTLRQRATEALALIHE